MHGGVKVVEMNVAQVSLVRQVPLPLAVLFEKPAVSGPVRVHAGECVYERVRSRAAKTQTGVHRQPMLGLPRPQPRP